MENGYNIYGPIIPYADEDKYPTHLAKYGKGGFVSLDNIETKDGINIPEERLEEGMLVYLVKDAAKIFFYQYLGGEWTRAKLPNNISISTDLDAFKNNSAEGDITVYNNKFYYKDSEGNVSILPAYEFKELKEDTIYNSTFTDENSNLVENSSIAFSVSGEDKNLNIDSSVKISLGDKTITSEDSESSISLPSINGTLALTSDISSAVDPVSEKLEKLISSSTVSEESIKALQEEVFESSSSYTSNYIHINPLKKTDSNGESVIVDFDQEFKDLVEGGARKKSFDCPHAKFLTVALGDNFKNPTETSDKTASLFLLISGKLTGSVTTQVFTDIVVITNRGKASSGACWDVRHVNDITCVVNNKNSAYSLIKYDPDSKYSGKWQKNSYTYIDLATLPGVSLDIKIIGKNFSDDEFKLTWYTDPVNEPDYTGKEVHGYAQWTQLPSFTDSSISIEIANTYKQQKVKTTTISLGSTTETKDTKDLKLSDYNTFIIDCENTLHSIEQGALTFNVSSLPKDDDGILSDEDMLYNTILRFVFSSTKTENDKGFDYFRITYNENVVLDLSGLRMEDGESIYVTPVKNNDGGTEIWSYYRESSFPKHDNTLIVKQDENKELRLGVNEETVSSQEKLYTVNYNNLINGDSGINVKLSNSNNNLIIDEAETLVTSIDLFLPKDASIVDIRLKDLAYYLKEKGLSDDINKIIALHGIRRDNDGLFQENKKVDVIIDFASPMEDSNFGSDYYSYITDDADVTVDKFIIQTSPTEEIVSGHGYNGYFVSHYLMADTVNTKVNIFDYLFGFNNIWSTGKDKSSNAIWIDGNYDGDNYMVIKKSQVPNYRHHFQLISLYSNKSFNGSTNSRFQYWGVIDTSTYFTSDDYYSEELETLDNLKTSLE